MKTRAIKKTNIYSPEEFELFRRRIIEQKYASTIVNSFVNSRLLNYWVENDLLPKWPDKGWRKFSFIELVWLKIVDDLRSFGLGFDVLKKLKDVLFNKPGGESLMQMLSVGSEEIKGMSGTYRSPLHLQFSAFIAMGLKTKPHKDSEIGSELLALVIIVILFRSPVILIVNAQGRHIFMASKYEEELMKKDDRYGEFLSQPYVSIPLTGIVEYFILEGEIDKDLKKDIFSEDELLIIETIRNEKLNSLTVRFDKEKSVTEMDVTWAFRLDTAHRVSDIILRNGYEDINITTQKGNILTCTKTKKIRPKK